MTKKPNKLIVGLRQAVTMARAGVKTKSSWYCQPCGQEAYSLRCKYCGKSEEEKS